MRFETESLENLNIQLIDGDRGKNYPSQADFFSCGYCLFLSAKNVTHSGFEFSEKIYIDKQRDELLRAGKLQRGDIILTTRGTIGNLAFYSEDISDENIRINSGMLIIRADKDLWNRRFLFYLLSSSFIKSQITSLTSGSAVPQLPARDIKKFQLPKIPKPTQNAIDKIIGDISEKIRFNTQTNQTLESIAQAIFKSWFVDFEPVKAKMAAKERWYAMQPTSESASPVCYADDDALPDLETYTNLAAMCAIRGKSETELAQLQQQNPNQYHQLAETAALFPSTMVGSELGEIPEGWEVCKFQEIANIIMGQSPAGDTYNSEANGIPLINGPVEFGDYYPERTKWTTSPTKLSAKGDLVVCVRGSTTGRFVKSDGQYCLGRGVCAIRGKRHQCFVDLSFKYNIEALLHLATGSTFPNWSSLTLSSFSITCPTDPIIIIFEEQIKALTAKLENGVVENHYLSQLRDSLLPKLLSGEIDLTKTESEIT